MSTPAPPPSAAPRWPQPPPGFDSWASLSTAILIVLLIVGAIEVLQYALFDILPRPYHHLSGVVQAVLIFALVILYVRWRRYALYGQEVVEQLRQAERWREDMTAMLIHDLKNPLISSGLALQAVLRRQSRAGVLSEEELGYLRMARESQVLLSDMIGDLLTIAQAENGSLPLSLEPVDLCAIATDVVAEMSQQAQEGRLELRNECAAALLMGDAPRLRRVVENLLSNAIKFTPPGGTITVATEARDSKVTLRVTDTGAGVPLEARGLIFDKFGQASTGHRLSVGLGLTFCRLIAEAHGGSIRVESPPGQGSTFIVSLPRGLDDGRKPAV